MSVLTTLHVRDRLYIGGEWVEPAGRPRLEVVNSATEEVDRADPAGTPADVDRAVAAARAAFPAWSQTSREERGGCCARSPTGSRSAPTRSPRRSRPGARHAAQALAADPGRACRSRRSASLPSCVEEFAWRGARSATRSSCASRSACVGAITPWNYPLNQIAAKVAPALAAGCTVVLKPSEVAPLNAFMLAEVIDEPPGCPAGVFNLVTGTGPVVGEAIAAPPRRRHGLLHRLDPGRAGGSPSWRRATVKPVALELGGKSPNVILDDADLARGGRRRRRQVLPQLGPDLQRPDPDARPARAARRGRGASPPRRGRGLHGRRPVRGRRPRLGPLVSRRRSASGSAATSRRAEAEGARLVTGGAGAARGPRRAATSSGPPSSPTSTPEMTIAQEEIFGPVLVDHALRRRGGRGADRQRLDLRPRRRRLVGRPGARDRRRPRASAPARSRSTAAPSTRWRRSAATSSPGTAARTGRGAWSS